MNKLVYIFVPNQFVIGDVVLKLLIKRLAVAMVNKTVGTIRTNERIQERINEVERMISLDIHVLQLA
jgi:hypothetical protein